MSGPLREHVRSTNSLSGGTRKSAVGMRRLKESAFLKRGACDTPSVLRETDIRRHIGLCPAVYHQLHSPHLPGAHVVIPARNIPSFVHTSPTYLAATVHDDAPQLCPRRALRRGRYVPLQSRLVAFCADVDTCPRQLLLRPSTAPCPPASLRPTSPSSLPNPRPPM